MAQLLHRGETKQAKLLIMPLLRVGLWLAGLIVVLISHGRDLRQAAVLALCAEFLQMPKILRALGGDWWTPRGQGVK